MKFKIEPDPEPNGWGGKWRFVPNQTVKACCSSQADFEVASDGMIHGGCDGKDEFSFNMDTTTGILRFEPSDPYYPIVDPKFCPYCGQAIEVENITP